MAWSSSLRILARKLAAYATLFMASWQPTPLIYQTVARYDNSRATLDFMYDSVHTCIINFVRASLKWVLAIK